MRQSVEDPHAYVNSGLVGFLNVLEACRRHPVEHLVYASSSSVYGRNERAPFSEEDRADSPASLYATTKKSGELMAYAYSGLFGIPCTGLRFFTVYGPMGRPDMAYFKFAVRIAGGRPVEIYGMGDMRRDFAYVDDIVTGIASVMSRVSTQDNDGVRHRVFNIGSGSPVALLDFVEKLERALMEEGVASGPAVHELLPMQPGDVRQTCADVSRLERGFGFRPSTSLEDGLREFARWYKEYYRL